MDKETIEKLVEKNRLWAANSVGRAIGMVVFRDGTKADVFKMDISYTYDGFLGGLRCVASAYFLKEAKKQGTVLESETVRDLRAEEWHGEECNVDYRNYGRSLRECRCHMQVRWEDPSGGGERWKDLIWFTGAKSLQRPLTELMQEAASQVDALPDSVFHSWHDLT